MNDRVVCYAVICVSTRSGGTKIRYYFLCPEARLGDVHAGIEDLASILWSAAHRKSARCTETVSFDMRNRGPAEKRRSWRYSKVCLRARGGTGIRVRLRSVCRKT